MIGKKGRNKLKYSFFLFIYLCIVVRSCVVCCCNSILFIVPLNILIYNILDVYFGIIFNVLSLIIFLTGLILHQVVIVKKQKYKTKSNETNFVPDAYSVTDLITSYTPNKKYAFSLGIYNLFDTTYYNYILYIYFYYYD